MSSGSGFSGDETAPFFGFLGAAAALVFSCMGAAYGTAKSGVGVASMGVMRPELVMKSIVPVVMAGVLGIYGLIIAVIISTGINPKAKSYYLFDGYAHLSSGLACGLAGLSAGMAIGIVGDAGVRANAQQPKLFVGMILILIFAEALALYGLIVGIILSSRADIMEHPLSKPIGATLPLLLTSLETTLRNFSCLTTGDSIMVAYNNKKYYINIIESKPSNAISIIETDCEVDFAPPLDYKEPERPASSVPKNNALMQDESAPAEEPKFNPFTGSGRRLDGKPLKYQPPPVTTSSGSNGKQPAVSGGGIGRPSSSSRQSQGKLVFGSKASSSADPKNHKEVVKDVKQEQPAKEEPKFQAFTGKKYSLKG
ncbi:hypothetical protein R6Q57_014356 [Mikania cordata]